MERSRRLNGENTHTRYRNHEAHYARPLMGSNNCTAIIYDVIHGQFAVIYVYPFHTNYHELSTNFYINNFYTTIIYDVIHGQFAVVYVYPFHTNYHESSTNFYINNFYTAIIYDVIHGQFAVIYVYQNIKSQRIISDYLKGQRKNDCHYCILAFKLSWEASSATDCQSFAATNFERATTPSATSCRFICPDSLVLLALNRTVS